MRWTERRRLMLQEMGIRLWAPVTQPQSAAPSPAAMPPVAGKAVPVAPSKDRTVPGGSASVAAVVLPEIVDTTVASQASTASPEARARAIAEMPWTALREAVAACKACGLCQGRRQTVFGVGHTSAHWMVVGEAPGEQEDLQGEPFVGPAGHLLDNMLRALRLTRSEAPPERQVYVANTLKCRPPRNRNPEPAELLQCEPFLVRQVELVRPRLILAMGRFAAQALLRSELPVGKLRGRVHRYQGVPLVVTYHPAYLLRNPADKARAWEDLCLAANTAEACDTGKAVSAPPL
jgi:uracil-DNA glycosylase